METLIELYDERPLENTLGVEMFRPKRVVYICPEQEARDAVLHKKLRAYFSRRGQQVELIFFKADVYDAEAVLALLRRILERYPDCAMDITGGTDAVLFAAGLLSAEAQIPVFTYSRKKNSVYNIRNADFADGLVCFLAMIATGITEELLFRGFLFRAMSRRNPRAAVILVSVLFGAGHLMNLLNGSGMTPLENICQVFYAVAVGFLFVAVLIRSGSLIPCMIAHAAFNALSVFANNPMQEKYQIPVALSLCAISLAAGAYCLRSEKKWF